MYCLVCRYDFHAYIMHCTNCSALCIYLYLSTSTFNIPINPKVGLLYHSNGIAIGV